MSPPGLTGIESVTALGNTNASPISNYYCNGYQGQQKYTIDKLEVQARHQAANKNPTPSKRHRSFQRARRQSVEVPVGADDKIQSSQFDMKQRHVAAEHSNQVAHGGDDTTATRASHGLQLRQRQRSEHEPAKIDINKHLQDIEAEKLLLRQLKEQIEDRPEEKKPLVTRLDFNDGMNGKKGERQRRRKASKVAGLSGDQEQASQPPRI